MFIVTVASKLSFEFSGFHNFAVRKESKWNIRGLYAVITYSITSQLLSPIFIILRKKQNLLDLNNSVVNLWNSLCSLRAV